MLTMEGTRLAASGQHCLEEEAVKSMLLLLHRQKFKVLVDWTSLRSAVQQTGILVHLSRAKNGISGTLCRRKMEEKEDLLDH